jgi:hypothetical protein
LDPGPGVEHVPIKDESSLQVPDFSGDHLTQMDSRLILRHYSKTVQIVLPFARDHRVQIKKELQAGGFADAACLLPSDDRLIADVLVDLPTVVENRRRDVPEELIHETIVPFVPQLVGQRR